MSLREMSGILPYKPQRGRHGYRAVVAIAAVIGFCLYIDRRDKQERQLRDMLAYKHFWLAWERWHEAGHGIAIQPITGQAVGNAGFWDFVRQYRNDSGVTDFVEFDGLVRQAIQYKGLVASGVIKD